MISVQALAGAGAFFLITAAGTVVWAAGAVIVLTVRRFLRR